MSWVEVDGAGWRWVHGLVIPNKQYHFLKVRNKNLFKCIYVNCFSRLRFLAAVSTKLQKVHFFRQFTDHSSGREHGN